MHDGETCAACKGSGEMLWACGSIFCEDGEVFMLDYLATDTFFDIAAELFKESVESDKDINALVNDAFMEWEGEE